jgi:hypothetical protein
LELSYRCELGPVMVTCRAGDNQTPKGPNDNNETEAEKVYERFRVQSRMYHLTSLCCLCYVMNAKTFMSSSGGAAHPHGGTGASVVGQHLGGQRLVSVVQSTIVEAILFYSVLPWGLTPRQRTVGSSHYYSGSAASSLGPRS